MSPSRQPAIFVPHGGGPCFWIDFPEPIGAHGFDTLRAYLTALLPSLPARPNAILLITAHWEAPLPAISTAAAPGMLYDYYGFPEHTYKLRYPAPGAPDVAARALALLRAAGIAATADAERGFDHGVFVPMLIVDPAAEIPVVQMSLRQDLDAAAHIAVGEALAPLRDEGVLILGSGNSYHNLRHFFDGESRASEAFDSWLGSAATADPAGRRAALIDWAAAPSARACHPREEHLIPLMVVAGAAGADIGRRSFHDTIGRKAISGFTYG